MSTERGNRVLDEDSLSMYDNAIGEVPADPIGHISHVDGNGRVKTEMELNELIQAAEIAGSEVTKKPHGEHNSTVFRHKRWVWVGGALAAAMGLTAAGLGTVFAIEHHKRKK